MIRELYDMMASGPVELDGLGITVERGQWAISMEKLGERAGLKPKNARDVARRAVKRFEDAGVLRAQRKSIRLATHTQSLSLITWCDFDAYDKPNEWSAQSRAHSPAQSRAHSKTQVVKDTSWEDTSRGDKGRASAAPSPGAAPTLDAFHPVTGGGAELSTTPPVTGPPGNSDPVTAGSVAPVGEGRPSGSDSPAVHLCDAQPAGLRPSPAEHSELGEFMDWLEQAGGGRYRWWTPGRPVSETDWSRLSVAKFGGLLLSAGALAAAQVGEAVVPPLDEAGALGKACGIASRMLEQRSKKQAAEYIRFIGENWPAIRARLDWMDEPPDPLDPATFIWGVVGRVVLYFQANPEALQTASLGVGPDFQPRLRLVG